MEENKPIPRWYTELTAAINSIAEELGLDDLALAKVREFVLSTAKSQYMAGNRAGIYWARNGRNKGAEA